MGKQDGSTGVPIGRRCLVISENGYKWRPELRMARKEGGEGTRSPPPRIHHPL